MKVVVDDKIPYIRESIGKIADEVLFLPGASFTSEAVRDADALIVRTRTRCDRQLLQGSRVRFIATATIGFDHIDTEYCREAGIVWRNAPGCNSASVAQYLCSALLLLKRDGIICPEKSCIGIVGVGNVGRKVRLVAEDMGMKVLLNDPPRAYKEGGGQFVGLDVIARECDVITFHTPLVHGGKFPTFHLADEVFFRSLERKPVFVNTSRGEVMHTEAVCSALENGWIREAVIDVWEHEPDIDRRLLHKAFLATPHIAGYSADGKANATRMALQALCAFFRIDADFDILPPRPCRPVIEVASADDAYLQMYNPERDSEALKLHPEAFEKLRGNYPLRREPTAYHVRLLPDGRQGL